MKNSTKGGSAAPKALSKEQQQLVAQYVPMAMKMGLAFASVGRMKGIPVEDLQQEACMGLCMAAQNNDGDRQEGFASYAFAWCKKYILKALRNQPFALEDQVEQIDDIDLACEADEEREWATHRVMALLDTLDREQCYIVRRTFGIGCREQEFPQIAHTLHLDTRRVQTIYHQAMAQMEFTSL